MNWQAGIIGAFVAVGVGCLVYLIWVEVRRGPGNRKHNLPPPSDACRRNSTEAVTK